MTEVEVYEITYSGLEVGAAFMSNFASHVSIYLSLVFGYCVVAYTAGRNLTTFQVIVASIMFVVAAEMQAFMMGFWVVSARELVGALREINPEIGGSGEPGVLQIFGIALWQAGILASLAFMWSIRRSKTE
jgi:glucan phosphoethanolaminetransferase (alkaline phosphatase superfamily)